MDSKINLLTLFWGEGACPADLYFKTQETKMASLPKKEHRPSGTINGEKEHASNAKKHCQERSEGYRLSKLFVGEGKRPSE